MSLDAVKRSHQVSDDEPPQGMVQLKIEGQIKVAPTPRKVSSHVLVAVFWVRVLPQ